MRPAAIASRDDDVPTRALAQLGGSMLRLTGSMVQPSVSALVEGDRGSQLIAPLSGDADAHVPEDVDEREM